MISLNLLVIKTNQMLEVAAFYTLLGFEFEYHQHGKGPFHYASKSTPLLEIYPLPQQVSQPDKTTRLGFKVRELDKMVEHLEGRGMPVIARPIMTEWGYHAIVQDPDGRKIELTEQSFL
ncbi:VOC family protein [Chitinophaga flava]|uniref:Glyoxalase/bleomycin resistance/extradiol dioxygenase family protein n=1 Tax=Chitinophaga flava TaxID=2259036 RepID=A0A365XUE4_9BACT|nr:VOC family protein [Chitinophaga flava]RBL89987.1 glyoxalase/bleomycin resistance/extradiol dioxygenase family protein [Chitinophaga flava]